MIFDEELLRSLIRETVKEALRTELASSPDRDEYLDVNGAAEFAKVHPQTIRHWINNGSLSRYHAGRQLRVLRSELAAVLASGSSGERVPHPETAALQAIARRRKVS